ncbi:MAG TPA: hypothetical protein VHU19_13185 [Pyrinomonadaceae bacterium]|jgi:hypothetical protein|nr:hypothetical protein [Pyrinomonadaceae bacterium]
MIKDSLKAIGNSAVGLFRNPLGLLLLCVLYFALLACLYVFFATGVASAWQLVLSALTALAAPLLFFVLQAAIANFAQPEAAGGGALARHTLRDFLKILLLSLPLIALAVGIIYLLGVLQAHLPKIEDAPHALLAATHAEPPAPLHWQEALISMLWLLLLGIILPLVAAHLWLSAARFGLLPTLKKIHRVVARAFRAQSVLIYAVGLFVFGLMPYFIIYTRTPISNGWAELTIFTLRLLLAFVFTLLGWTITLGALARTTPPVPDVVGPSVPVEGTPPNNLAASEAQTSDVAA